MDSNINKNSNKTALVVGGGGFIGTNLVKKLKSEGWEVTAVDLHEPYFEESVADNFIVADARYWKLDKKYDRIYQLAADMGGAGFVFTGENDAEILSRSVAINMNILDQVKEKGCGVIFYSSSVCIYSPEATATRAMEADAYPASADSNYGWEKLYSERLYEAYARNYGLNVQIARFNNTYGPHGVYEGGREKSPAAVCRKVILANPDVEIWGDGKQIREFVYIDDLLTGIEAIIQSDIQTPINIGPDDNITIDGLVELARKVEDKEIIIKHIDGPIGLQNRRTGNDIIKSLGWKPEVSLEEGIKKTYLWIKQQIDTK
jgi:nucleoside-diphosphate-sugar epimerase